MIRPDFQNLWAGRSGQLGLHPLGANGAPGPGAYFICMVAMGPLHMPAPSAVGTQVCEPLGGCWFTHHILTSEPRTLVRESERLPKP